MHFESKSKEVSEEMNGESKKSFAVALASFAVGAVIVGVLGNSKAREKLAEAGRKLAQRNEVA